MLGLSRTTGYAIAALRCLSNPACGCKSIPAVSSCSLVPKNYLAKIILRLTRAGLVKSKRGAGGGISLACSAQEVSLLEIVEAVEGKHWLSDCLLGLDECTDLAT